MPVLYFVLIVLCQTYLIERTGAFALIVIGQAGICLGVGEKYGKR